MCIIENHYRRTGEERRERDRPCTHVVPIGFAITLEELWKNNRQLSGANVFVIDNVELNSDRGL